MSGSWHRLLHRCLARLYFDRLTVLGAENLPESGPVMVLGLHRNGAVDGFVYRTVAPRATFMLTMQLRRTLLGRLFFDGIEVARDKDRRIATSASSLNARGLEKCLGLLEQGGMLCVFPEGTSSLGPRHLPFKSGASHLALDYQARSGKPLVVVPMGIHYEAPTQFRSHVEVVFGKPVSTELPIGWSRAEKLRELKRRFEVAMEAVGVNVASEEYQDTIQRLAYVATLGTRRSYFHALKQLETNIPATLAESWNRLATDFRKAGLRLHQGVPLFPVFPLVFMFAVLGVIAPITLAGWLLNAPPLLAGVWAGRRFPDDSNVVSLWRILVGAPASLVWIVVVLLVCALQGHPGWFVGYALITVTALKLTRLTQKVLIEINNGLRHSDLRGRAMAFHQQLLSTLPDEEK